MPLGRAIVPHAPGVPVESLYDLEQQIGDGGYSVVRRCRSRTAGTLRACKSIDRTKVPPWSNAMVEAEILMSLNLGDAESNNIVQLTEVFEDNACVHLILELCVGGELYQRQSEAGRFSERQAKGLLKQMLKAIVYIHKHCIVHRDLKLENWLLMRAAPSLEGLRLCDFGLSAMLKPGEQLENRVGSPYYVAPEIMKGTYDFPVDLWSLGVILYMLISGLPPFNGVKPAAILMASATQCVNFESSLWTKVSPHCRRFILELLSKDAAKRPTAAVASSNDWFSALDPQQIGLR